MHVLKRTSNISEKNVINHLRRGIVSTIRDRITLFPSTQVSYRVRLLLPTQQTTTMKIPLKAASDIIITSAKSSLSENSLLMPTWVYHLSAAFLIFISLLGLILNSCFLLFILRDCKVQYFFQ